MLAALREAIIAEVERHISEGDCPTKRSYNIETLEAVVSELAAPVAGDMVMVPREPTEAMLEAGHEEWLRMRKETGYHLGLQHKNVFAAMIREHEESHRRRQALTRMVQIDEEMESASTPPAGETVTTIPPDMKPWHGKSWGPPKDHDYGPVMRRNGQITPSPVTGNQWLHVASHADADIIAYTPKPAAGGEGLRELVFESLYHLRIDEAAKRYHEKVLAALASPSVDREAVAKIIDPPAWSGEPGRSRTSDRHRRTHTLKKAAAILALIGGAA